VGVVDEEWSLERKHNPIVWHITKRLIYIEPVKDVASCLFIRERLKIVQQYGKILFE
tara:strand:+ start:28 stop:198 length:171 start_codon:yes stop_codon:yes gene_type:complete